MQGSYRTARIVETRNLFLGRLRHCVWAVEQEDCNLLVGLPADIHRPMNTGARFFPLNLSRRDSQRAGSRRRHRTQWRGDRLPRPLPLFEMDRDAKA